MKRRTLLQALGALLLSLIGIFPAFRRRLEGRGLLPPARRVAPVPLNAGWQHLTPRPIPASDVKNYVPAPVLKMNDPGVLVVHNDPGVLVVCAMRRPARSDFPVYVSNYPSYRDAMRAAGALMPETEPPSWPEMDTNAEDREPPPEDNA